MYGLSAVAVAGAAIEQLARARVVGRRCRRRSASAAPASTSRRIVDACSAFQAITGIITFSSSCPASHAIATVVSQPITWKQTWFTISGTDGFTLPGMIDEPGCTAGSAISDSPARGPMLEQAQIARDLAELRPRAAASRRSTRGRRPCSA